MFAVPRLGAQREPMPAKLVDALRSNGPVQRDLRPSPFSVAEASQDRLADEEENIRADTCA
jgi:hypothetical protein